MYNKLKNNASTQTSLIVKIPLYGKRHTKNSFYLHRRGLNFTWWIPNNLSVFKSTTTEMVFPTVFKPIPPQYILSLVRPSFMPFLFHHSRNRTTGSSDFLKKQWLNSATYRTIQIARFQSNERFPARDNSGRFSTNRKSTQHNQAKDVFLSKDSDYSHTEFRFQCFDSLWESGVSRSGLQPLQAWQKIISSIIFFREPSQNQFKWRTPAREENEQIRSYSLHGDSTAKNPFYNRPDIYPEPSGCRILLQGYSQFLRRKRLWLCHGRTGNQSNKNEVAWLKVPRVQSAGKKSHCRIFLSTPGLEKTLSFHRDAPNNYTRPGRTDSFYIGQIRIPGICNQSGFGAGIYLVLLQATGFCRNKYQRAKIRFLYEQNTYSQFSGQSVTSATSASGLRFISLVSDALSSGTISIKNIEMDSAQYTGGTRPIHYAWSSEHTETSEKFSKRTITKTNISKCTKSALTAKIGQFSNDSCKCSDESIVKNSVFPQFLGSYSLFFLSYKIKFHLVF